MKLIMLINVKMPTIVGILTFISRINTISECFKAENNIFSVNYFYLQLKFHAQLSMKKGFVTFVPGSTIAFTPKQVSSLLDKSALIKKYFFLFLN